MQKVKNQHPAIGWAIDVTQISRKGVLGLLVLLALAFTGGTAWFVLTNLPG